MSEFDRALADIVNIRSRLAASALFQGFGPVVIATTGGLGAGTAALQSLWPATFAASREGFFFWWIAVAIVCAGLIGAEMIARSRRIHGGLADAMLINAAEQFLPAGLAGAAIAAVMFRFAPDTLWMLPGLWQILVALGLFSAVRSLPRAINVVGAWYLVAGVTVLMIAAHDHSRPDNMLSPWLMGLPFAVGQLLMAVVLWRASGEVDHGES